jgi:hypothetical protein
MENKHIKPSKQLEFWEENPNGPITKLWELLSAGKIIIARTTDTGKYKIFKYELNSNGSIKSSEYLGFIDKNTLRLGKPWYIYLKGKPTGTIETLEAAVEKVLRLLQASDSITPIHTKTNHKTFWIIYYGR